MKFFESIQKSYGYTDYEIAQVKYLFVTLASEISKIIIFAYIWWIQNKIPEYCVAICILFLLRSSSGGIHYEKYVSCLIASFVYLFICINILPLFLLNKWIKLLFLFFCMVLNLAFSPIVSKYRIKPTKKMRKRSQKEIFFVLLFYFVVMSIIQPNPLIDVGFWCIFLHTVQLIIAHILVERRNIS